jgi:hypothetical protein
MDQNNSQKAGQFRAITLYQCGKCKQTFRSEAQRDQHKVDVHSKETKK